MSQIKKLKETKIKMNKTELKGLHKKQNGCNCK